MTTSPYGEAFVRNFKLCKEKGVLPILATRSLAGPQIVAVHGTVGEEQLGMTEWLPSEDTYIVAVSPTGVSQYELWRRGHAISLVGFTPDSLRVAHQGDGLRTRILEPYESVSFLIRRAALDAFTSTEGYRRVANLASPFGAVDPTMSYLVKTLLPFFARPQEANPFLVDHVELAVMAHLVDHYGDSVPTSATMAKGGLTPAQARRVKEMLSGDLKGDLLVTDVARECGLSRQHLIRAFKKTTGSTPHQWLQWRRVDKAKDLLKNSKMPVSDIAIQCGFADQSHLTKVFAALAQTTPAVWRKQNQS